jgi:uncharacterized protein YxjI
MADYDIPGVDLTEDSYDVVQSLVRNRYRATNAAGEVVLRSKQKLFKMREEFPFTDGDGNEAFTVKAGGILDIAGDYSVVDPDTDDPVITLDNQWTLFADHWKVRDPDTEALLAEIESTSTLVMFLRHLPYLGPLFSLLPHSYDITDADGDRVGGIEGQFSVKDRYEVTIDDATDVPREAVTAAAMVIDAIEGN